MILRLRAITSEILSADALKLGLVQVVKHLTKINPFCVPRHINLVTGYVRNYFETLETYTAGNIYEYIKLYMNMCYTCRIFPLATQPPLNG
jgi:hypothetical protein